MLLLLFANCNMGWKPTVRNIIHWLSIKIKYIVNYILYYESLCIATSYFYYSYTSTVFSTFNENRSGISSSLHFSSSITHTSPVLQIFKIFTNDLEITSGLKYIQPIQYMPIIIPIFV